MSEQRLVTLHGGPLDGRAEAWEAGQVERVVKRWIHRPDFRPCEYVHGRYRAALDSGDAAWFGPAARDSWQWGTIAYAAVGITVLVAVLTAFGFMMVRN